jgi:hypothetical protein
MKLSRPVAIGLFLGVVLSCKKEINIRSDFGGSESTSRGPGWEANPATPPTETTPPSETPAPETGGSVAAKLNDCEKTVYPSTGRNEDLPGEFGKRNYASGKPSEVTWESEKNVDKTWEDYELTAYFKMGPGEDNAVFKMYGPNHSDGNKGWYVYGINNDGKAVCGGEDEHPKDNPKWDCEGGEKSNFGSVNDKWIGLKTAIWTDAAGDVTVESYVHVDGDKWVKMASQKNPEGRKFKPQNKQNLLLRADGFKDFEIKCARAQEIKAPG